MSPQVQILLQQAIQFINVSNLLLAEEKCKKALEMDPINFDCLSILGAIKGMQGNTQESIQYLVAATAIKKNDFGLQFNLAKSYMDIAEYSKSLPHHRKAISLNPEYPDALINYAKALKEVGQTQESLACYEKALALNSQDYEAWMYKGLILNSLREYDGAINAYDICIQIQPTYWRAFLSKADTLHELKRYDEALICLDKAISIEPNYAEGWSNKAATLTELKRYDEALFDFEKALKLKPSIDWLLGNIVHAKMQTCNWDHLDENLINLEKQIQSGRKASFSFALLSLFDNPTLHKQAAEIYINTKYPPNDELGDILKTPKKEKIRIGYYSADFKNHPVSMLMAELFELHDKSRFETYAFSLGADDESQLRQRLTKSFSQFIDVQAMSDRDIAELSRKLGIDIAVDLGGLTQNARTGLFAYRSAPIQVNYLGYPGTLGANYIDYLIADKNLIPVDSQKFYAEKIVYLPHTYMVDDSTRIVSNRQFSKKEFGLPEDTFIFCCFNNAYKFNPQVISSWAKILKEVDESVLWISENNNTFKENLLAQFQKHNIERSRVIFASRIEPPEDHLARYVLADLFLDTQPYNAHTTAVDSLKAGVPVITLVGQSFACRVAASLLHAIELPELITTTQSEYENLAVNLAKNPNKLSAIKNKLVNKRSSSALFNTSLFTKHIESAYIQMYERHQGNLLPDHIFVNSFEQ